MSKTLLFSKEGSIATYKNLRHITIIRDKLDSNKYF
jgi:hypothetical protein